MLNERQFEAKWNEIKAGIRNLWGRITNEELEEIKGNLSEISALAENKYGETKLEIGQKLNKLLASFDNDTDKGIRPDHQSYMRSPLGEPENQLRYNEGDREINYSDIKRLKNDSVNNSPQREV